MCWEYKFISFRIPGKGFIAKNILLCFFFNQRDTSKSDASAYIREACHIRSWRNATCQADRNGLSVWTTRQSWGRIDFLKWMHEAWRVDHNWAFNLWSTAQYAEISDWGFLRYLCNTWVISLTCKTSESKQNTNLLLTTWLGLTWHNIILLVNSSIHKQRGKPIRKQHINCCSVGILCWHSLSEFINEVGDIVFPSDGHVE